MEQTNENGSRATTNVLHAQARKQYRVAIADDNELMREGIACVVERDKQFCICGFATDKKGTITLLEEQKPDLLLLNLFLRDADGLDLLKHLVARFPGTRIVVSSAGSQELYGQRLLHAGASSYLSRRATAQDLLGAIRLAMKKKPPVTRPVKHHRRSVAKASSTSALTDRELHVFRLIGRGMGTGDIARELGLSPRTIEYYREQIKIKLGYRDTPALRKGAFEWSALDILLGSPLAMLPKGDMTFLKPVRFLWEGMLFLDLDLVSPVLSVL
jgi:DNA-binding NarL/FixJ family response regulator